MGIILSSTTARRAALFVVSLLLASAAFTSLASAREWTDSKGRKVEAEFVRIDGENVVLNAKGREVNVSFWALCEEDRTHLSEQLLAKGMPDRIPTRGDESGEASEADAPTGDEANDVMPTRVWKDRNGNELEAQLIDVDDDTVYLKKDGAVREFQRTDFSDADQAFLTEWIASGAANAPTAPIDNGGEYLELVEEIAPPPTRMPPGGDPNGTSREYGGPVAGSGGHGIDSVDDFESHFASAQQKHFEQVERARKEREQQDEIRRQKAQEAAEEMAARWSGHDESGYESSSGGVSFSEEMVYVYECEACGHTFESNKEFVGMCPNCKKTYKYVQNEDGSYTDSSGNRTWTPYRTGATAGSATLVLALIGIGLRLWLVFGSRE